MNPAPPVTHDTIHVGYSEKPAATASRRNICTVSSEYCIEVLAEQVELLEQVVGHGDDVTPDLISLHDVEYLPGEAQISSDRGASTMMSTARRHHRHRIDPRVGDPSRRTPRCTTARRP